MAILHRHWPTALRIGQNGTNAPYVYTKLAIL